MAISIPPSPEYIAGFFDGEGCITMRRCNRYRIGNRQHSPSYSVVVLFTNRDLSALEEFQSVLGGTIYRKARKRSVHADAYELNLFRKDDVQRFLDIIGPHVRMKRAQIALVREFIDLPRTKMLYVARGKTWPIMRACPQDTALKESYKLRLTELNKRGPIIRQPEVNLSNDYLL